jgi:hypothetical protein
LISGVCDIDYPRPSVFDGPNQDTVIAPGRKPTGSGNPHRRGGAHASVRFGSGAWCPESAPTAIAATTTFGPTTFGPLKKRMELRELPPTMVGNDR